MTKRVFLDYAATAPQLPEVHELLLSEAVVKLGNASTLYLEGRLARQDLEQARQDLAATLGCSPESLFFCSGGTEAAGTLIEGIARGCLEKSGPKRARMHIICAAFEHHAVLDSVLALKHLGYQIDLLRPRPDGRIEPESLAACLRPDTLMVVVMLAQNELGTIMDVERLSQVAHAGGALFMSDCVQAFSKLPIDLAVMGIDAASFSAHKIGGPYGMGAFYLRPTLPFLARQLGGGQERKLRSGTQDVPSAMAFALAAKIATAKLANGEAQRLASLRDDLQALLIAGSNRIRSTVAIAAADVDTHLPGHLHLLVEGIESQTMVLKLDELGFAVSGGAACSSSSLEPSHVLMSMGISKDAAYGALRITLGRESTPADCARFAEALLAILA